MPRKERYEKQRLANLASSAAKCKNLSSFFSKHGPTATTSSSEMETKSSEEENLVVNSTNSTAPSSSSIVDQSGTDSESTPAKIRKLKTPTHSLVKVHTVESWRVKANFGWLEYDKTESGFYVNQVWCSVCREVYGGDNSEKHIVHAGQAQLFDFVYVNGTSNVKKDTAKSHGCSRSHVSAVAKQKAKKGHTPLQKQLMTMPEAAHHRMEKLFDWAYFVAKTEEPFRQFVNLVEMEDKHGSDMGLRYRNDKACRTFIDAIGSVMKEDLASLFQSKPFYCSLLFDGSTDKTLSEKEVLSIKVIVDGIPTIKLLGISHPKSQKAEDIYNSIMGKTTGMQLSIEHCCIGAGADGASVNFGKHSGVMTRLETSVPWLLKIHCVAHRLELSLKDAFKGSYFADVVDDFLLQLFYMFKRSEKKWKNLNQLADVLGETVVKLTKAQGTRWIDHRLTALKALHRDYKVLRMLFEDMGSGLREDTTGEVSCKVKGYLKHLKTYEFGLYLAAYTDLCEELAVLSKSFQAENLPITSVRENVEVTALSLRGMLQQPGPQLVKFEAELSHEGGEWSYRGVQLVGKSEVKREFFRRNLSKVIEKALECIDARFVEFSENPLLLAFDVFDPSNFPANKNSFCTFGNEEVKLLVNHFAAVLERQGCEMNMVEREWLKLKLDIQRNHAGCPFLELWGQILREKSSRYPNVIHLIHILLVCPVATSHVERQFSTIKRILGDWRLRMGLDTCEHLLRIITEGPSPKDFKPKRSVALWHSMSVAGRRVDSTPLSNCLNVPEPSANSSEYDSHDDVEINTS